jgi:hypothetical protein
LIPSDEAPTKPHGLVGVIPARCIAVASLLFDLLADLEPGAFEHCHMHFLLSS